MVEPRIHNLLLVDNLSSQYSISNDLFCLMLDTAITRAEIGQSWEAISNYIDISKARDLARHNRQIRN